LKLAAFLAVLVVIGCGRYQFDPRVDAAADAAGETSCPFDGGCRATRKEIVGCFDGPTTGDQLCQRSGYVGATIANGYYWFQCTGFVGHDCPGGFDLTTLRCTTWCGNSDCASWPYCGSGEEVQEVLGTGATVFDPEAYGKMCGAFNPGWIVMLDCYR
jgi:hypothetical protein